MLGLRLIRVTRLMQCPVKPIAATVASEHPSRAIRSVSTGSQSYHEEINTGSAQVGDRFTPVVTIDIGFPFCLGNLSAMFSQPRAAITLGHATLQGSPFSLAQNWLRISVTSTRSRPVGSRNATNFITFELTKSQELSSSSVGLPVASETSFSAASYWAFNPRM